MAILSKNLNIIMYRHACSSFYAVSSFQAGRAAVYCIFCSIRETFSNLYYTEKIKNQSSTTSRQWELKLSERPLLLMHIIGSNNGKYVTDTRKKLIYFRMLPSLDPVHKQAKKRIGTSFFHLFGPYWRTRTGRTTAFYLRTLCILQRTYWQH